MTKDLRVNEQIRVRQVRLISEEGEQLGIVDTRDALERARNADLDLVLVGEKAQPPVARIMDYGKFRYELQQQQKEARKRNRQQEVKSIKFRVKIEEHDYQTKVNHIRRFLEDGNKVRTVIMFRGRERTHPELGQELLQRVAKDLADVAIVESSPSLAGMDMNMMLAPGSNS
ncbi:MAG: translation initiation factor IF-3 [Deinococcales bacterium]